MALTMISDVKIPIDFNVPDMPTKDELESDAKLFEKAKQCILDNNVFLIAHYYTSDIMQRLAEVTNGFIGDSLEMARAGRDSDKNIVAVAGVRFMGETAKILSPEKTIIMPDLSAECSLDLCCNEDDLKRVKEQLGSNVTVVSYANTSAKVKSLSDWIVTSSLAVELSEYLSSRGESILWLPDRHLGSYIANKSKADVYCWPGKCIVHDSFEANAIKALLNENKDAQLLVHPEAPSDVVDLADFIGSTSQILNYAKTSNCNKFIIATEKNIFYKISQACPNKVLLQAPVASQGSYCISCANCPWMQINTLEKLINAIENVKGHEIYVDEDVREKAKRPLDRMLNFASCLKSNNLPKDL